VGVNQAGFPGDMLESAGHDVIVAQGVRCFL
jgi:hypothetical protein